MEILNLFAELKFKFEYREKFKIINFMNPWGNTLVRGRDLRNFIPVPTQIVGEYEK